MTKQEEIKEIMYGVAAGGIKAMVGLQLLSDLGVVIKVDAQFPDNLKYEWVAVEPLINKEAKNE